MVEAASYGAVDDDLLLLIEKRYHALLCPDRPLQPTACPVHKKYNRRLLSGRGRATGILLKCKKSKFWRRPEP